MVKITLQNPDASRKAGDMQRAIPRAVAQSVEFAVRLTELNSQSHFDDEFINSEVTKEVQTQRKTL